MSVALARSAKSTRKSAFVKHWQNWTNDQCCHQYLHLQRFVALMRFTRITTMLKKRQSLTWDREEQYLLPRTHRCHIGKSVYRDRTLLGQDNQRARYGPAMTCLTSRDYQMSSDQL